MATPLDQATRQAALPALAETGWRAAENRDAIRKIMKFKNFSEAWAAMSRIALLAEKIGHHPEWRNVYNLVDVTLTTHDCCGLSDLDLDMARRIDALCAAATVQTDHSAPILSLCEERAGRSR